MRVLSDLLRQQRHHVSGARDGATALMIATADPPDLILLDVLMPEMDGFAVCQQLKSNPITSEVPVIFISGLDELVDKMRGFEAGGVDYITKPFRIEEVRARINRHLDLHRLRQALDQRNAELRERVEQLAAINRIAQVVATTADLHEMLANASQLVTALFANRVTLVSVRDGEGTALQILAESERGS